MIHALKVDQKYFGEIICGRKTFEIRKEDRDFREGDLLALNEYEAETKQYTGYSCLVYVDYILRDAPYVPCGYVAMSIKPCVCKRITEPESCHNVDCKEYAVPLAPGDPWRV
ncbi:MAG: DUF3850 domain-containing protein [Clostridia bacterium]|nr:DUF3850 domain-containing protein [Clostridia bacterium]